MEALGKSGIQEDKLITLRDDLATSIFDDYLEKYEGEVVQLKEPLMTSAIYSNELYELTFNVNGVQYNNKTIYVVYSDKYETNTLIPFDPTSYYRLIPTKSQRVANKGYYSIFDDQERGFNLPYDSRNTDNWSSAYIDDIDFVYNIKVD